MSPAFLRAADGMGWAVFVLGLVCALATLLLAIARPADISLDLYLFLVLLAAGMLAGSHAFHRRRWWAWDLSTAIVLSIWMMARYFLAAQIAPADPSANTRTDRFITLGLEVLFFGIPFPAAAVVLFHNDVRRAFPHSLPLAARVVAAFFAVGTPLQLIEAISADPRLFFGLALPRWGTVLWAAAYLCAAISLYQRSRFGRPAALVIAVVILAQAAAGLFRPSLSSLPPNFPHPTIYNGFNLLFGLAIAAALLRPLQLSWNYADNKPG